MKSASLLLSSLILFCSWGIAPITLPVGKNLKSWQAQAATETPAGYVVIGTQNLFRNRSRLIVVRIDSTGQTRWQRKYPHLKGAVAGYGVAASDGPKLLVTGSQNGIAKLWCINAQSNGDMQWTMSLDSGLARSAKLLSNRTWAVAVESPKNTIVYCLSLSGKIRWKKHFFNPKKAKVTLCAMKDSSVLCAFASTAVALNSLGKEFWHYQNEAANWQNMFVRQNEEVILLGSQKVQFFGPVNDEAIAVATLPHQNKIKWLQLYGHYTTFDVAHNIGERPNGQLVILASQNKRIRLIELTQSHSIAQSRWLTDTLSNYQVVEMLNQSAWQQKWFVIYNATNGTVWIQPTKIPNPTTVTPANIQFRLHTDYPYTSLRPLSEVPPTFQCSSPKNTVIHLSDVKGEGYVYLLSKKSDHSIWEERDWILLGSKDSLILSNSFKQHILMITQRPYANPLQLLLKSDAYRADALNPERPMTQMSDQYPSTFDQRLNVDISTNGERFQIRNLPSDGWIPIVINSFEKNSSSKGDKAHQ